MMPSCLHSAAYPMIEVEVRPLLGQPAADQAAEERASDRAQRPEAADPDPGVGELPLREETAAESSEGRAPEDARGKRGGTHPSTTVDS
jgi:hypothetical protein